MHHNSALSVYIEKNLQRNPCPQLWSPLGPVWKSRELQREWIEHLKKFKKKSIVGSTLPGCVTVVHFLMSVSPYLIFQGFCVVEGIPVWLLGVLRHCRQPRVICCFEQILDWQCWTELTQSPLTALDFLICLIHLGWEMRSQKNCSFCDNITLLTSFCRGFKTLFQVQKVLEKICYSAGELPLWDKLKIPIVLRDKHYLTTLCGEYVIKQGCKFVQVSLQCWNHNK